MTFRKILFISIKKEAGEAGEDSFTEAKERKSRREWSTQPDAAEFK